ncbi:MAG: PEP-CTERM sorting domain-containing protein [Planctomycetales bacterium]|nr:PEP-CTERM sorting domain-containing protein [Planctomycetales bacterium]
MKSQTTIMPKWTVIAGWTAAVVLALTAGAQGADDNYALLIQVSPPDGGVVSPGMGVLTMPVGQKVPLSATPKQGYRFLYWLGDISSNDGTAAVVSIDSPKLVVAVFARENFEENLPGVGVIDGQPGDSGQRYIGSPVQPAGSANPGGGVADSPSYDWPDGNENPEDDDIPVPGDGEVPEPATVLLLGLGSAVLLRQKRH